MFGGALATLTCDERRMAFSDLNRYYAWQKLGRNATDYELLSHYWVHGLGRSHVGGIPVTIHAFVVTEVTTLQLAA